MRMKATPHNSRLAPQTHVCLHIFRHILRKCSGMHQVFPALFVSSDEKYEGASGHLQLCGVTFKLYEVFVKRNRIACNRRWNSIK
jgi:hypothetical protein